MGLTASAYIKCCSVQVAHSWQEGRRLWGVGEQKTARGNSGVWFVERALTLASFFLSDIFHLKVAFSPRSCCCFFFYFSLRLMLQQLTSIKGMLHRAIGKCSASWNAFIRGKCRNMQRNWWERVSLLLLPSSISSLLFLQKSGVVVGSLLK